ncbi:MAG: hypothetical protein IKW61_05875 [Bacteroidaceae bacterium]|nr:hypothetical protein [Bacteroidaceae bacterium]
MKKLFILAFIMLSCISLSAQERHFPRRGEGQQPGRQMQRRNFDPETMARMEVDAINAAVGLDSLQYQLVYILKYSDMSAMQDSMKVRGERMRKMAEKGEKPAAPQRDDKSWEEMRKASQEIMKKRREAMNEQMKQILSPEQYQKYLKYEESKMMRPRQGMGRPGGKDGAKGKDDAKGKKGAKGKNRPDKKK